MRKLRKSPIESIEKMRPISTQDKLLSLRKECGMEFYKQYSASFVEVRCPACFNEGVESFTRFSYKHRYCEECSTKWCSPRPTEALLQEYYSTSDSTKYWTSLLVETDIDRKQLQYIPRINNLLSILRNDKTFVPKTMADLGAGSGAFASSLNKLDYFDRVIAVDFDTNCYEVCQKLGLDAILGSAKELEDSSVDLITMNDMIEHLFNPSEFLKTCYAKLSKNGYISIACPNGEGFDFQIMKEKTINVVPPEHLNYFNPKSMDLLLSQAGFEMVSLETPGILDISIVKREFELGNLNLKENGFVKSIIESKNEEILSAFQSFLQKTKQSSHMVAIARKSK